MYRRFRRSDPRRGVFGAALLYCLVERLLTTHGESAALLADFGASAVVATVVSLLGNLFNWRGGKVDSSTITALNSIRGSVVELGQSVARGIVDVAGKIAAVGGTFIRFIQKTFGKLYDLLTKVVVRIARILDRIFGPVIDFLNKIRVHLKKFYDKVLKPIVDTIEMVRACLRVLSFFGVDWSKTLDAKLAELERYVLAPYEWFSTQLNKAFEIINRIVTGDGLLQRLTLLQSLLRDANEAANLVMNSSLRDRGTGLVPRDPGGFESVDPDIARRDLREHFRSGESRHSGAIRESVANVKINLRRAA